MKLYALDVGVYARAPLLPHLAQLTSGGRCIVTRAVLQVFRHRLQNSIRYFLENYRNIKQAVLTLFPRHSRRQSIQQALRLLEAARQGMEDVLLYTALRAIHTAPSPRQSAGLLLEKLLVLLDNTRHTIGLLDTLYFWLRAASSTGPIHSLAASIEHVLNHYLENTLGCTIGVGEDYTALARTATRLAEQSKLKDREDVAVLLSLCTLEREITSNASEIVLLTTDHRVEDTLKKLRSHNGCLAKISIHVTQA
ncbi:hypothetical protein Pyrde_1249 [Pyrodictium delaneyi]|uniref:Uncharacterized protein n=1 Tax=Pyrodictium delaneyi TaxID=1273541 RepID=A0A0N7JD61_9CREN|nr:hypothetical protein [Pyrodictium delaneyi]ALL01297.1 hypothetical protein Pyrde_1249 [Pyrodictium delaneyi]OWJ55637.1 hypothetical protein Pdsh_02285 [Pyrodictium delaneyi]